ncbi:hypothetical protein [Nonlabens ponticola]|uniref:Uncharacterized protein n=1 Tax=Nonlabens ponticola TaxID=2496866 RepID=A0A3S9MVQ1_9FLAO|nr:hypothetical protein [Nonlabens ponticola]AZQ43209.1 hypothetical protein EJ995_02775 [Nonlabens ponticola]
MAPKYKTFGVYLICFLGVFVITHYITVGFFTEPTFWTTFIPIAVAMIVSPKPHIEETVSGKRYGLKSLFSPKIYWFD